MRLAGVVILLLVGCAGNQPRQMDAARLAAGRGFATEDDCEAVVARVDRWMSLQTAPNVNRDSTFRAVDNDAAEHTARVSSCTTSLTRVDAACILGSAALPDAENCAADFGTWVPRTVNESNPLVRSGRAPLQPFNAHSSQ